MELCCGLALVAGSWELGTIGRVYAALVAEAYWLVRWPVSARFCLVPATEEGGPVRALAMLRQCAKQCCTLSWLSSLAAISSTDASLAHGMDA
jgi:hypothetical protein